MTTASVSVETVEFVSKLVAARTTTADELAEIIALVNKTLTALGNPPETPLALAAPAAKRETPLPASRPRPVGRPRKYQPTIESDMPAARALRTEATVPEPVVAAAPAVTEVTARTVEPTIIPAKRGRGRPRRVPLATAPVVEPVVQAAPEPVAQPKLLRRAEWIAHEQEIHPTPEPTILVRGNDGGPVRGVVKWYDGRTGKGILRLAGISSDIALDAMILERSGLKRLYKDQEIEATTQNNAGRIEVLTLNLPGRVMPTVASGPAGEGETVTRRQPRPITIEVRRDGGRQKAARAEAEEVFANLGGKKPNRRLSP